jgi:hypothetical protein
LANYISKLTNHAIKSSTKGNSIMYSRNKWGVKASFFMF